nr:MAG TPA: hypothetical protein [Caudoviricetes sp.]
MNRINTSNINAHSVRVQDVQHFSLYLYIFDFCNILNFFKIIQK